MVAKKELMLQSFLVLLCLVLGLEGTQFYVLEADWGSFSSDLYVSLMSASGTIGQRTYLGSTYGCFQTCPFQWMRSGPGSCIISSSLGDTSAWTIDSSLNVQKIPGSPFFYDLAWRNGDILAISTVGNPDQFSYAIQKLTPSTGQTQLLCNNTFPGNQYFELSPVTLGPHQDLLALIEDFTQTPYPVKQIVSWDPATCEFQQNAVVGNNIVSDILMDVGYLKGLNVMASVDLQGNVYEFGLGPFSARNVSRGVFGDLAGNVVVDEGTGVMYFLERGAQMSLAALDLQSGKTNKITITGAKYSLLSIALVL